MFCTYPPCRSEDLAAYYDLLTRDQSDHGAFGVSPSQPLDQVLRQYNQEANLSPQYQLADQSQMVRGSMMHDSSVECIYTWVDHSRKGSSQHAPHVGTRRHVHCYTWERRITRSVCRRTWA